MLGVVGLQAPCLPLSHNPAGSFPVAAGTMLMPTWLCWLYTCGHGALGSSASDTTTMQRPNAVTGPGAALPVCLARSHVDL